MLKSDGKVTCKFGPLESSICGLEWGPHGHLYIDLGTKLLTTSCDESQPLLPLHAEPTTALSVSTKASFLALGVASPNLGFQVSSLYMCWKRRTNVVVHPRPPCFCSWHDSALPCTCIGDSQEALGNMYRKLSGSQI